LRNILASLRTKSARFLQPGTALFASTASLTVCVLLAFISVFLGQWEESLLIQTNGYIALIDIGNSVLFLVAVDRSTRSADTTFNYGYGKYESLAILVSANLLTIVTIFTIIHAISLFREPPAGSNYLLLLIWSSVSFFIMRLTARRLERSANRLFVPMLRYDAELWRVDSWVELGVLISLLAEALLESSGWFTAATTIDAVASIALLGLTLKVPLRHGAEAFRHLTDRTLPDDMQSDIMNIIQSVEHKIYALKAVHTRQSGKDIFIEIDIVMPGSLTLNELYNVEEELLAKIRKRFPTAIPRVYTTPSAIPDQAHGKPPDPGSTASSLPQSEQSD